MPAMNIDQSQPRGLVKGLPMELYQKHPALSRSRLEQIRRSPAHFKWDLENERDDTEAFRTGRLIHGALLEPGIFWPSVVVWADGRRYGKKWDEFQERHEGKTIITVEDERSLLLATEAFKAHPVSKMIDGGDIEASLFWQCPTSGPELKARPDCIGRDGVLYDLKTTLDARPEEFTKSSWRYGYHRQAAWYLDGVEAVTGEKFSDFVIVAIEKAAPHAVQHYVMDQAIINRGRAENRAAMDLYLRCKASDTWPAYSSDPMLLSAPAWIMDGEFE